MKPVHEDFRGGFGHQSTARRSDLRASSGAVLGKRLVTRGQSNVPNQLGGQEGQQTVEQRARPVGHTLEPFAGTLGTSTLANTSPAGRKRKADELSREALANVVSSNQQVVTSGLDVQGLYADRQQAALPLYSPQGQQPRFASSSSLPSSARTIDGSDAPSSALGGTSVSHSTEAMHSRHGAFGSSINRANQPNMFSQHSKSTMNGVPASADLVLANQASSKVIERQAINSANIPAGQNMERSLRGPLGAPVVVANIAVQSSRPFGLTENTVTPSALGSMKSLRVGEADSRQLVGAGVSQSIEVPVNRDEVRPVVA